MPKISEIIDQKDKKKKFSRKEYRPWNLSETLNIENKEPKQESITQSIEIAATESSVQKITLLDKKAKELQTKVEDNIGDHFFDGYVSPEILKSDANLSYEDLLIQLSGRQKELFILILRNLIDHKSILTSPMYSSFLVEKISTSLGTIKSAVRRLEAKGLIKSVSKRARGGHFRFEVREEIIQIGQRLFFRP